MSEQHTPGRIFLAEAVTGRHSKTNMRRVRSESEGLEHGAICEVYGIADGSPAHANARRLVACWNACDGISTDVLENIVMLGDTVASRFKLRDQTERELIVQRDELLAALEQIERLGREADGNLVDVRAMLGDIARAAIAKVKGGAL